MNVFSDVSVAKTASKTSLLCSCEASIHCHEALGVESSTVAYASVGQIYLPTPPLMFQICCLKPLQGCLYNTKQSHIKITDGLQIYKP